MADKKTQINPGDVVAFSSGEYSDYRVGSFARALKPITKEVWEELGKACSKPPEWDKDGDPRFDEYKAVPWLVARGYIEEIEYHEMWMGDYGRLPKWPLE